MIMSDLTNLLKEFSEREFAFFYYYRYPKFTKASQLEIDSERVSRFLDKDKIRKIVAVQFDHQADHCLRCNSDRFQTETEISPSDSGDHIIYSNMCLVCGYNPDRGRALSFKVWLRKIFGKYREYGA